MRPRTRAEYKRVLESLQRLHGDKSVANIRRRHIRKMRDERADTPGAANTIVRMFKIVLNFAVEEEWIAANPAAKMRLLKVGEWRAWTDEECAAFETRWAARHHGAPRLRARASTPASARAISWRWRARTARTASSASCRARQARSCGYPSTAS